MTSELTIQEYDTLTIDDVESYCCDDMYVVSNMARQLAATMVENVRLQEALCIIGPSRDILIKEVARKDKALLLAARWFKLNFDDDTLNEHPPSKADLAGMFDAMQEARSEYPVGETNDAKP